MQAVFEHRNLLLAFYPPGGLSCLVNATPRREVFQHSEFPRSAIQPRLKPACGVGSLSATPPILRRPIRRLLIGFPPTRGFKTL